MIDEQEFFTQATLRICSSLEIDEVARECLKFLQKYIPLDGIMMNYYDERKRSFVILAIISKIPLKTIDQSIPISSENHQMFSADNGQVIIFNQTEDDTLVSAIWSKLGCMEKSSIVLFAWYKKHRLGQIDFFARGRNRYTEEHKRLIKLLHNPFSIAMANSLQYQQIVDIKDLFSHDIRELRRELKQTSNTEIIGTNGGLRDVMEEVTHISPLNTPVLLLGETGVGKELIANRIHYSSQRKDGPFVKINCGAIPEGLIDSELFGHEKGAFTGALAQKNGHFERAHQGTIFLDEVGDLPASVQVRLLRVLQEKEFERVGGAESIKVDVRVIAATHRNLDLLVQQGVFREDLWFRLNVFPISIPPLRERKQDISLLVHYFIIKKSEELNLRVHPELASGTMERLINYEWPGNVRELQNIVERVLIKMRISGPNFPLTFEGIGASSNAGEMPAATDTAESFMTLDQAMKQHIQRAMTLCNGRIQGQGGAAELLDIHPNTLRHRMRMLGVDYGRKKRIG